MKEKRLKKYCEEARDTYGTVNQFTGKHPLHPGTPSRQSELRPDDQESVSGGDARFFPGRERLLQDGDPTADRG